MGTSISAPPIDTVSAPIEGAATGAPGRANRSIFLKASANSC